MGNKGEKNDKYLNCDVHGNFIISSNDVGLDLENIKNFLIKAFSCTCIIKLDSENGAGFFCKIPTGDKKVLINFLFTSNNLLTAEKLSSSKDIIIEIDGKEKKLSLKNRKIYYNSELNYSCIEILNKDKIKGFYSIDELNNLENLKNDYYINKYVMIISLMKNGRLVLFNGLINSEQNNKYIYESNSYLKYSGGAILNPKTNCIIGIHNGETIMENKKENIYLYNGNSMKNIINDINNNMHSKLNKQIKIKIDENNNGNFKIIKQNYIQDCIFEEPDEKFVIVLGGDTVSGKTTYFYNLLNNPTYNILTTIGNNNEIKKLRINNPKINFDIWDTCRWAGNYDGIIKGVIKKANGILLLFSLSDKMSFSNLDICCKLLEESLGIRKIPILLLGTHADNYERVIETEIAINYSKNHNFIGYFEVSSKNGKNVNESFQFLANSIYKINIQKQKLEDIKFETKLYDEY